MYRTVLSLSLSLSLSFRVHGVNLLEYFTYNDHLTEPCVAGCIEQILSALSYLHDSNIAHLDIKVCVFIELLTEHCVQVCNLNDQLPTLSVSLLSNYTA